MLHALTQVHARKRGEGILEALGAIQGTRYLCLIQPCESLYSIAPSRETSPSPSTMTWGVEAQGKKLLTLSCGLSHPVLSASCGGARASASEFGRLASPHYLLALPSLAGLVGGPGCGDCPSVDFCSVAPVDHGLGDASRQRSPQPDGGAGESPKRLGLHGISPRLFTCSALREVRRDVIA